MIASLSSILISGKFSVLVIIIVLSLISKKILSDNGSVFFMSISIGILVSIFFYWYWEMFYGNVYFLGLKSDDWQYDEFWTKGFLEVYKLRLTKLSEHLNSIESGLGILHNSKGYVAVIIFLRYVASFFDGYHTLIPRILNVFILGFIAHYSSLIAFHYNNNLKLKKNVFLFVFFFPVMLFNSVHVFRDTIVGFIIVYIYYLLLTSRYSLLSIIKLIVSMIILYYFRKSTFFVVILMVLILYMKPKTVNLKLGLSITLFLILAFISLQDLVINLTSKLTSYGELNAERLGNVGSKIFSLPLYIGVVPRFIYLIFTPVPNFSGFHQLYQSIGTILQIVFFPYLFVGIVKRGKIDFKLKIIFLLFFIGVAFSTATFRHVIMYLPLGIVIACLTYYDYKLSNKKMNNYLGYLLLLLLAFGFSIGVALMF